MKSLIGKRSGLLVVIAYDPPLHVICRCACGNQTRVWKANLYRGNSESCGCKKLRAGGLSKVAAKEYDTWTKMRRRCSDPSTKEWKNYGGRGIRVCERWQKFENFLADMGRAPSKSSSLDRKNNDGHYEHGNCRWATKTQQMRNMRKTRLLTFGDRTQCISAWAEETGIPYQTILQRHMRGLPAEIVLLPGHLPPKHWVH